MLTKHKNNCCFLSTPTSTSIVLWTVRNGVPAVTAGYTLGSAVDWGQPHRWLVRIEGADLDVAVQSQGAWQVAFSNWGNGLNALLTASAAGSIGLATTGLVGSDVACSLLRYGFADSNWAAGGGDGLFAVPLAVDTFTAAALSTVPHYDAAGNLTDDGQYEYVYDAWNRLVEVWRHGPLAGSGSAMRRVATYRYDGLGHRVYKKVENSGEMNREEYFYYNKNWQLLEIADADSKAKQQFVWGSQYIDEGVCMDVDTDDDGDCTDLADTGTNPAGGARRFFYMQDANWNVIGLTETTTSGPVVRERYEYDPYGTVRIYKGSAAFGAAEQRTVTGQSLKWLDADLPGNPHMYCGYFQDSETDKYHVRHRMLGPDRWLQRDPVTSVSLSSVGPQGAEDTDLYLYASTSPATIIDPMGLYSVLNHLYSPKCDSAYSAIGPKYTGGVICYYGQKIACNWYRKAFNFLLKPDSSPGWIWAFEETERCADIHEWKHMDQDNTDCDRCKGIYVITWPTHKDADRNECHASLAERDCLLKKRTLCDSMVDPEGCKNFFDDIALLDVEVAIKASCTYKWLLPDVSHHRW